MSHEWHRGVLDSSSWHGLEEVGVMIDADQMIAHGERSGAWPVALRFDALQTVSGIKAPGRALVASYSEFPESVLSVVGDRYRATSTDEWRTLVRAATAAGGKPTGAFSLRGGTRALATFEVGVANGLRTQLLLADAFDGTMKLTLGTSSIRVVCANTLSRSLTLDGAGMAKLKHTASLETKVNVLAESIGEAIAKGEKVRTAYHRAEQLRLSHADAEKVLLKLFPDATEDSKSAKTRAENARNEAARAALLPVNDAGPTLATLWNAATYVVDRTANGDARPMRGEADALDSMLFGTRADRVEEIQTIVELMMRDGTVQHVPASEALAMGANASSVGRLVLDDMLG